MTQTQRAIHNFNYWYEWHGHWIYESKEAAFKTWVERGIAELDVSPNGVTFADLA